MQCLVHLINDDDDEFVDFFCVLIDVAVALYRAVCRQFGINTGRLTLGLLVFAPGMFGAATAFLPSSFGMMTTMVAVASWFIGNLPAAIFFTAAGALVGWPFTGALGYGNKILLP